MGSKAQRGEKIMIFGTDEFLSIDHKSLGKAQQDTASGQSSLIGIEVVATITYLPVSDEITGTKITRIIFDDITTGKKPRYIPKRKNRKLRK
jgi:hypothetical protein